MTGVSIVTRGDARALQLPDASVDLIVTSPPYFALRSYQDGGEHYDGQIGSEPTPAEFLAALWECTREWVRVLKPSGSLWVNLGDKYAGSAAGGTQNGACGKRGTDGDRKRGHTRTALGVMPSTSVPAKSLIGIPWRYALGCIDELGLILRAEVIWSKPNGLPESVTDRVRRSHEQWFHFTVQPRYYSAVDEIRQTYDGDRALSRRIKRPGGGKHDQRAAWEAPHPLGSIPGSVWEIATEPLTVPEHVGVDHFAAFPTEWPRRIIAGWSPDPDTCACCQGTVEEDRTCADCGCDAPMPVVLDPFGGTGTVALVAKALGRIGISNDLSADYCRLAKWRTSDPAQIAKAMRVDKPPVQVDGQADLIGGAA